MNAIIRSAMVIVVLLCGLTQAQARTNEELEALGLHTGIAYQIQLPPVATEEEAQAIMDKIDGLAGGYIYLFDRREVQAARPELYKTDKLLSVALTGIPDYKTMESLQAGLNDLGYYDLAVTATMSSNDKSGGFPDWLVPDEDGMCYGHPVAYFAYAIVTWDESFDEHELKCKKLNKLGYSTDYHCSTNSMRLFPLTQGSNPEEVRLACREVMENNIPCIVAIGYSGESFKFTEEQESALRELGAELGSVSGIHNPIEGAQVDWNPLFLDYARQEVHSYALDRSMMLLAGTFEDKADAQQCMVELEATGLSGCIFHQKGSTAGIGRDDVLYSVLVDSFTDIKAADEALEELINLGFDGSSIYPIVVAGKDINVFDAISVEIPDEVRNDKSTRFTTISPR